MAKEIKSPFLGGETEKPKDPRFTDSELQLLKKLDEETLKMFRSVFYQDELTAEQEEKLKSVLTLDLVKVIRKFFVHDLDWQEPLFSMPNRWNNPKFDALLTAEVPAVVKGRQMAIRFLEKGIERMGRIVNGDFSCDVLDFDIRMKDELFGDNSEIKAKIVAMQDAISFLESGLLAIQIYTMSPEDLKKLQDKMKMNSAR